MGEQMINSTILNCGLILIGAFIMLFSIIKSKHILEAMPLIPEKVRGHIAQLLSLHRLLISFFLVGYVVVLVAFYVRLPVLSNLFVSVIFFFGAIFVFMGIAIEVRLLDEIQKTLSGLVPICAKCKKIRESNADANDPKSWKRIEEYISARADVKFTHGYCPDCLNEAMQKIETRDTKE
jgi:magnesium-transporting ATPase (P-type)